MTMVPGSSKWFERGFVTYTNASKREVLDVPRKTLVEHGAVSEQTVSEMVRGALAHSRAEVAVAVSGVAGPSGGTLDKPVGTVCIAWGIKNGEVRTETQHFPGDREAVRRLTVERALSGIIELLRQGPQ